MQSLPENLSTLYRIKAREAEDEADATGSHQTTAIEQRAQQVKAILRFLRIQVESREGLVSQQPPKRRYSYNCDGAQLMPQEPTVNLANIPSALALLATSTNSPWPCAFCFTTDHALPECHTTLSREDKLTRLHNARCCFKCGKRNHTATAYCSARHLTCGTCGGRHMSIPCNLWRRHTQEALRSDSTNEQPHNNQRTFTSVPTSDTGRSSVLLQTTKAWAPGQQKGSVLVRILLDTGSQQSFITSEVPESLR